MRHSFQILSSGVTFLTFFFPSSKAQFTAKTGSRWVKLRRRLASPGLFTDSTLALLPLQLLIEGLVWSETTTPSLDTSGIQLPLEELRDRAKNWEAWLGMAEKARCILFNNGGPNLPTDRSLLLADWINTLEERNSSEKVLHSLSEMIQSSSNLAPDQVVTLSRGSMASPRGMRKFSPHAHRKEK